jgi:Fic family protein
LGEYIERKWEGDPGGYGGRRARSSFTYQAWLPDPILDIDPAITFETAGSIEAAEAAVGALNSSVDVIGLEAIGPLLLRSEAIASSKIEGFELSQRNLAWALIDPRAARGTAKTVAANVVAMEQAIALGEEARALGVDDLRTIHATLMATELSRTNPGQFREEQNWIGGRLNSPIDARYIPPPESDVPRLIEDLMRFVVERDDLPATAQAAIAHAQFETIHPFIDGNGRVGRCLIHLVLRRRGLAPRFVPPISIVLAARSELYVDGLVTFREGGVASWCASFAGATQRAAALSIELADQVYRLKERWVREARVRRDSTAARILDLLPAQPIVSAATIRAAAGVSHQRALVALKDLETVRIVRQITEGGYDRQYAADELFDLIERFEEDVADKSWQAARIPSRKDREVELLTTWERLERNVEFARLHAGDLPSRPEFADRTVEQLRAARRWLDRNNPEVNELSMTVRLIKAAPDAIAVSDPHLQASLTAIRVLEEAYDSEQAVESGASPKVVWDVGRS